MPRAPRTSKPALAEVDADTPVGEAPDVGLSDGIETAVAADSLVSPATSRGYVRRSPEQRAVEDRDRAAARVGQLQDRQERLSGQLAALALELADAKAELVFRGQSRHLPAEVPGQLTVHDAAADVEVSPNGEVASPFAYSG